MVVDRVKVISEMARQRMGVEDLARRAGVSRSSVTAVRSGKSCSTSTAKKLALGLGVPLSDIVNKEGAA